MIYYEGALSKYIEDLSSGKATPGGGSASALGALQATSLLLMAAHISTKKLKDPSKNPDLPTSTKIQNIIEHATKIKNKLSKYIDKDVQVFQAILKTYKELPKSTKDKAEPLKKLHQNINSSIQLSLDIAELSHTIILLSTQMAPLSHEVILSDVAIAGILAFSSMESAIINTHINIKSLAETHAKNVSHETPHVALRRKLSGLHSEGLVLKRSLLGYAGRLIVIGFA